MALTQVTTGMIADGAVSAVKLASDVTPTGTIQADINSTKSGWLKCDGSIYTRTTYPALAALVGTPIAPYQTFLGTTVTPVGSRNSIQIANNILFRTGTGDSSAAGTIAAGLYTSTDGATWTSRTGGNIPNNNNKNYFAYNGSIYVQKSLYGISNGVAYVVTSSDTITWTHRATPASVASSTNSINELAYGSAGNRFISVNQLSTSAGCPCPITTYYFRIATSTDGITWVYNTTIVPSSLTVLWYPYVAASATTAVILTQTSGGTYQVWYSTDALTWTDITSSMGITLTGTVNDSVGGLSYVNGLYIITNSTGNIYTSTTGAASSWSLAATGGPTTRIRGNANGYASIDKVSTDLINWITPTKVSGSGQANITAVPTTGSRFYGYDTTTVTRSVATDLYNYTTATQFPVPTITTTNTTNQMPVYTYVKT